jgi:hypothetical protein
MIAVQPDYWRVGWIYRKHMSRDRYPARLLARRLDLQKTRHVITIQCCDVTAALSVVACSTVFTELLPGNALINPLQ